MEEPDGQIQEPDAERRAPRPRELAMSAAWHGGLARTVETIDGSRMDIVFHGHWSHGFGPDFSDAMIDTGDGQLKTGAVEIHTRSSDWSLHGHHLDPRYNAVILHIVSRVDAPETRRADGRIVPTAILDVPDAVLFAIDQRLPDIWADLGGVVCAEDLALRHPERIRNAILRLGDLRLNSRVERFEGELAREPAPDVALRAVFDAFGYAENRLPMTELAEMLLRNGVRERFRLVSADGRFDYATALLLGLAGFLPMSPHDARFSSLDPGQLLRIESIWQELSSQLGDVPISPTRWTRARTRPANHPVARLVTLATLLNATIGDPFDPLIDEIRTGADLPQSFRSLCSGEHRPALGKGRAVAIAGSVILPIALAHARNVGDEDLEDAASRAWASLPTSDWSRPAKRALAQAAGVAPIQKLGERGMQGLLHLDRNLCTPRRCFECPVAADVARDRQQ